MGPLILYDSDCGFCRWSVVQAGRLVPDAEPVAIQSAGGSSLLSDLTQGERLRQVHVVIDGKRYSGGAAVAVLAARVRWLAPLGRWGLRHSRFADRAYRLVADRRALAGRLVPRRSRERADRALVKRAHTP